MLTAGQGSVEFHFHFLLETILSFLTLSQLFQVEFRPLENGDEVFHLSVASPHILAIDGEELLFRFSFFLHFYIFILCSMQYADK